MAYTKKNTTASSTAVKQAENNDAKMENFSEANIGDSTEAKVAKN